MLTKKQIGSIIKAHRITQSFTQNELCKAAGVSQSLIAKAERGALHIRFVDAMKIADFLEIDWKYYLNKSKELKK